MIHYKAPSYLPLKTWHRYDWHIFPTMSSNWALSKVCSVQRLPRQWLHPTLSHCYCHGNAYTPSLGRQGKACVWRDRAELENTKWTCFSTEINKRIRESLQKNESRYFIFQGVKKNKTFTTFFKSGSFKGTLAKINEDSFSQCTLDFASLHRCLPPSLILIHSTYNISFNSGTATEMRLLTSWRN